MVPRYEDADTPEAQQGRQLMMDAKFLEDVSQQVNDLLNLPYDVPVIGKQCGQANAFWDPSAREISMCYEDVEHSDKMFTTANDPNPVEAAVDSEISTFYHELGHATLAIYELPFTGREEDVADQLSAFMLLSPGADGKPYPNGVRIATNAARMWKLNSHETGDANDLPFWDTHSFDLTRMYNWECWIYGSDPAGDANIVSSGDLPEDRAGGCQEEFVEDVGGMAADAGAAPEEARLISALKRAAAEQEFMDCSGTRPRHFVDRTRVPRLVWVCVSCRSPTSTDHVRVASAPRWTGLAPNTVPPDTRCF